MGYLFFIGSICWFPTSQNKWTYGGIWNFWSSPGENILIIIHHLRKYDLARCCPSILARTSYTQTIHCSFYWHYSGRILSWIGYSHGFNICRLALQLASYDIRMISIYAYAMGRGGDYDANSLWGN
jgi:hypothetical protein